LSGVAVSLSVDHGFFTPNCTSADVSATTNYANCTFDPAAAAGGVVGNLKSLGKTITATTDTNGQFKVTLGMGRDAALDVSGNVTAVVTGTVGSTTVAESNGTGNSPSTTTCATVGQSAGAGNNGAPQPGCATGTPWTTDAAPLNGGAVTIVSVPNTASEAPLSDTKTNNIPVNNTNGQPTAQARTIVLHLTDQFGNLTSGGNQPSGNNAGLPTLSTTGVGTLAHCVNPGAYSNNSTCSNASNSQNAPGQNADSTGGTSTTSSNGQGVSTVTFSNVRGSYLSQFSSNGTPTQDRYVVINVGGVVCNPFPFCAQASGQFGTQTLVASWNAPTTKFNTFTGGTSSSPAVATYTAGFATKTDTVTINWYNQNSQVSATFTTTPGNTVAAGTVVTVSAKVVDQFGNPVQGDNVTFVRSGPNPNNGTDCSATNGAQNTNAQGQAGFTFTCNSPGTQTVTVVVTDASGNELARGTQTITFTGSSTGGKTVMHLHLACKSHHKGKIKCVAQTIPARSGLTVKFFNKKGHKVGTDTTNTAGKAVLVLTGKKSGKEYTFQAHVKGSASTFAADSKRASVICQ